MRTKRIISTAIIVFLFGCVSYAAGINTNALLTDTRVVYVFDQGDQIDWALIYYLACENGCQVDLATVKSGPVYKRLFLESDRHNITLSRFFLPEILYNYLDSAARQLYKKDHPDTSIEHLDSAARELYSEYLPDSSVEYLISLARELYGEHLPEMSMNYFDSVAADLFGDYLPDIIIFSSNFKDRDTQAFDNYLLDIEFDTTGIFKIQKYFRRVDQGGEKSVYLNTEQYFQDHSKEITEMAAAVAETPPLPGSLRTYSIYDLIKDRTTTSSGTPDFLAGIERLKFDQITQKYIKTASGRKAYETYRDQYVSYLEAAEHQGGLNKIESLISALGEMQKIRQTYYYQIGRLDSLAPMARYIEKSLGSLSSAIFQEADIDYRANIEIRDTPEGKRLKFKSEVNNNGFLDIEAGWLEFNPPGADTNKIIDSSWTEIKPNNSLVRQYTVDIDPKRLETINAREMRFIGRVKYGGEEVSFTYTANAYEESPLSVEFVPDFLMIKPFGKLNIDRLVEAADLKVIIRKPADFVGKFGVKIITPPGVMAGAYREEIDLQNGQRAIEMGIPLVMTYSAGTEKKQIEIDLIKNGKVLASDRANIRQAEFSIPENLNIALFPDYNGLLEDILIETGARYRPISERFLVAGDFSYYDAIFFGTRCYQKYNSLEIIRDKIKDFMEFGGTVVVFGQPDEWRDDLLPVSIISTTVNLSADSLLALDKNNQIFKTKFNITPEKLMSRINAGYVSYPAVVFPGEKIIKSSSNTTVLSQTKLGKGRLIYCGLPLLEMIRDLDIDAIKLFSNLVHYSGE